MYDSKPFGALLSTALIYFIARRSVRSDGFSFDAGYSLGGVNVVYKWGIFSDSLDSGCKFKLMLVLTVCF